MKPGQKKDPAWIGALCRIYSGALWLYPPAHRKQWGAPMRQAFRDRCREAAREGRGPFNVLFAELLPDLATTVGSEHFDAIYLETNPMKRLLFVLIFTFFAVVLLRPDVTPAVDGVRRVWQHHAEVAYDRAFSAHLQALAQTTEQQRHGADDDVTAAILYWNASNGSGIYRTVHWDFDHLESLPEVQASLDAAASNALRDRADAVFARALKADDRWALWLAVQACPARPKVCAADASFARLKQVDAGNGLVWLAEMAAAQHANDPARERAALARLARSKFVDTHDSDATRAMLRAFDQQPLPSRLIVENSWVQLTAASSAPMLANELAGYGGLQSFPDLLPAADYCRSKDVQIHAERQADCRAAGKLMAEQGLVGIGYHTWLRNADPGELGQVRAAYREQAWQSWGAYSLMAPLNSDAAITAWKAAWLVGGNRSDVNRRLMRQQGIAMNAPASYQLLPEQINPATD